jgi:SAM-dependent methyltransferase
MFWWLYFFVFIFVLTFSYACLLAAPWVPMYARDVKRGIGLAEIKAGERFYDLGAGDGRTLLAAAALGAQAEGFEISLLPYLIAKFKIIFSKVKNKPKIYFRDLWKINLGQADVIFVFLLPRIMQKMKEKMEKELKPGARIICYTWPMPGWTAAKVSEAEGGSKVYLYCHSREGGNPEIIA